MREVWNFSAGPAQLPQAILSRIKNELLSYNNSGMSVLELSHRTALFEEILADAEAILRRLLKISDDYAVLFMQGGASLQFPLVALNLRKMGKAGYIHTGIWSKKAMEEAERINMAVEIIASSSDQNFTYIPEMPVSFKDYDYIHLTSNNTIEGTAFKEFPNTGDIPLIADMSSNLLSEPVDVSKFGVIYAGAQKNLGIAGVTLVIIRKDLLNMNPDLPKIMNYQTYYEKDSAYNTPPTFAVYVSKLMFEWLEAQGGLAQVTCLNQQKAAKLYEYIDQSNVFNSLIAPASRSVMNIPFVTDQNEYDQQFIEWTESQGIRNIKGHASVGGMRASLYNAMPMAGVDALIETMIQFENSVKGD